MTHRITRYPLSFLIILFFLLVAGCATLPKIEEVSESSKALAPPEIVGPKGELSPEKSEAVIERLEKQVGPKDILETHIAEIQSASGKPLVSGNKITLLMNGDAAYPAMLNAIQNAKDHINFETYIFDDDEIGRRFSDLLLQKQAEGVQVNLSYDALGCLTTPASFFQRLRDGGVQVFEYNPVNPWKGELLARWLIHRDHRKILVVDGTVAFTGSVNVSRVHSSRPSSGGSSGGSGSAGKTPQGWRDTHIQIEGPAVAELQKLFLEEWTEHKGPELSPRNYFPPLQQRGNDLAMVVGNSPGRENREVYLMYQSAFKNAENFIHVTNSYFVPDKDTVKGLIEAKKRGIDVKLILPGTSDVGFTFYAGRFYYTRLLESGVKLFERGEAILHAKTAVIDGVWSTVGSTNMDQLSFRHNDEVNLIILSAGFAERLEAMFQKDLEASSEVVLDVWKKRSVSERLKEWFLHFFGRWL